MAISLSNLMSQVNMNSMGLTGAGASGLMQMQTADMSAVSSIFDKASLSSLASSSLTSMGSLGSLSGSQDANAYMDYLNSDYSSMVMPGSSLTSGDSKATGIDITKATSSEGISDIRTSYLKQWFPGMSDETIAKLNSYYEKMMKDAAPMLESIGLTGDNTYTASGTGSTGNASAGAKVVTSAGELTGTQWGADLANDAEANANGPGGWCFKWVRQALERHGVTGVGGASAYMAADQLANNSKFSEVSGLSKNDLPNLPAGAVVVWDRGNGHEHGHISISLGDGREASDKIRNQTVNYGTSFRVFMPKQ